MEDTRICRRCLLRDMTENGYFKSIREYIEGIDEDIKTNDLEYEHRLTICKECENLMNGMCRICGCFVEIRASISSNYCPDIRNYWGHNNHLLKGKLRLLDGHELKIDESKKLFIT